MSYCSPQEVQRKRIKRLYSQVDPMMEDLTKLIISRKYTPAVRAQVQAQFESLSGYLKNQRRRAGV
jgi:hypothetical protein